MSLYEVYIHPLLIKSCMLGCRIYTITSELINNNQYLKEVMYRIKPIYFFMTAQRLEPLYTPWCHMYSLDPDNKLIEIKSTSFSQLLFENLFKKIFVKDMAKDISDFGSLIPTENISPLLVIKGNDETYLVRRGPFSEDMCFTSEKSNAHFLSIEYTHPKMNENIELELSNGWYMVGNELFTPSFVLRSLEFQSNPFYFDELYKIRIMDHAFNILEFGSDMFVEILKENYVWKKDPLFVKDESEESDESDEQDEQYEHKMYTTQGFVDIDKKTI